MTLFYQLSPLALVLSGALIISMIFAYLLVYHKDFLDRWIPKHGESFAEFFDRLVESKKYHLKGNFQGGREKGHSASRKKENEYISRFEDLLARSSLHGSKWPEDLIFLRDLCVSTFRRKMKFFSIYSEQFKKRHKILLSENLLVEAARELFELNYFQVKPGEPEYDSQKIIEKKLMLSSFLLLLHDDVRLQNLSAGLLFRSRYGMPEKEILQCLACNFVAKMGANISILLLNGDEELVLRAKQMSHGQKWSSILALMKRKGGSLQDIETLIDEMRDFYLTQKMKAADSESARDRKRKSRTNQQKQQKKSQQSKKPKKKEGDSNLFTTMEMGQTSDFNSIKKQYKKLVLKYHPDRLASESLSRSELEQANQKFLKIQNAYSKLEKLYAKKSA